MVFQAVHRIGNSLFALETNIDTLKNRLKGKEEELFTDILQNISSMQDRIQEIKELEQKND